MTTPAENPSPDYLVLLVRSISHAMKSESALTKAGVPHKLVPVPRSLSSQCGVCIRVAPGDREAAETTLEMAGIEIVAVHEVHDRMSRKSEQKTPQTSQTSRTSHTKEPQGD